VPDKKTYYRSIVGGQVGFTDVSFFPFGLPPLDKICAGGIPVPRITELSGPSAHGKTALVLQLFKNNPDCTHMYIDSEGGVTKQFAEVMGYTGKPIVVGATCIEEGFDKILNFVKAVEKSEGEKGKAIIVWDSISATPSQMEYKHKSKDFLIGSNAVAISKGFRKISNHFLYEAVSQIALVLVSQVRVKIGEDLYGDPDGFTSIGGKSMRFHSRLRLRITRKEILGPDNAPTAVRSEAFVLKSSVGKMFQRAGFTIDFARGLHSYHDQIDLLIDTGQITVSGGWLRYKDKSYHREDLVLKLLKKEVSFE